jgi:soluble lytic murein transglycosylase-like protein
LTQKVPATVAPIVSYIRRLGRRSSPICITAFAFSLTHLVGPVAPNLQPPALQAAVPAPQAVAAAPAPPLAAPSQTPAQSPAQSPAPSGEAAKPAEAPKPASPEVPKVAVADAAKPAALPPAPATAKDPAPAANPAPAAASIPAPAPAPAPLDSLERLRKAADLLLEANAALGVPRSPYGQLIYEIAVRHSINPQLVAALIHVESSFNSRAVSPKGAYGLMQLLPGTARRFGLTKKKDLFDPKKNLEAGVKYLKWLTTRFGGDVQKILAAYNAGEGAVERFGGIPPYRETQQYVKRIFGLLGFTPEPPAASRAEPVEVVAAGR